MAEHHHHAHIGASESLLATRHHAIRDYVIGAVAWYAIFAALPNDLKGPWFVVGGFTTAIVSITRALRIPPPVRRPAILMVAAGFCSLTGGVVRGVESMLTGNPYPFPSTADVFVVTATVVPAFIYLLRTYDQVSLVTLLAMMVVAVITTLPQIYLYDYYKEVYLHATRPGEERRRESVDKAEARAATAKAEGAPIWVRFSLNAYVGVLKNQQRVVRLLNPASIDIERSETTEKSAEIFRRHNHGPMQLWTFISLCPHSYLLAIAAPVVGALRSVRDSLYRRRLLGAALLSAGYFFCGLTYLMFGY